MNGSHTTGDQQEDCGDIRSQHDFAQRARPEDVVRPAQQQQDHGRKTECRQTGNACRIAAALPYQME